MKKIILAVPVLALLPLTACGHHPGKASAEASSASASAHAFATSSAGVYDKAQAQLIVKKCLPAKESAQLKLAEPVKGSAGRKQVVTCFENFIPAQNRTAFDDALLNDVLHGALATHASRVTFTTETLPQLVVKNQ